MIKFNNAFIHCLSMNTLNIIHLSDLHILTQETMARLNLNKNKLLEQTSAINNLKKSIKCSINKLGFRDIVIVVTGDITYSGHRDEYEHAFDFFKELKDTCGISQILTCPGNHDFNRKEWIKDGISEVNMDYILLGERKIISAIDAEMAEPSGIGNLKERLGYYYAFVSRVERDLNDNTFTKGDINGLDKFYYKSFEEENVAFNFISLNSSFLFTTKNSFYGYLSKKQVEGALTQTENTITRAQPNNKIINIVMFHHPIEAQPSADLQEIKRIFSSRTQFMLFGHVHAFELKVDYSDEQHRKGLPIISGSRCIYDGSGDINIVQGYSLIEIGFDRDGIDKVDLYTVKFNEERQEWGEVQEPTSIFINENYRKKIQIRSLQMKMGEAESSLMYESQKDLEEAINFRSIGDKAFQSRNYSLANECYDNSIRLKKDYADVYYNKAAALYMEKRPPNEIYDLLNEAEILSPENVDTPLLFMIINVDYGKLEDAWKYYDKVKEKLKNKDENEMKDFVEMLKDEAEVLVKKYNKKMKGNDKAKAAERFESISKNDPCLHESKSFMNILGLSKINIGKYQEAVKIFYNLLRESPNELGIMNNLAYALAKAGSPKEALKVIKKAIKSNKGYITAYITNIEILQMSGQKDKAIRSCLNAIKEFGKEQVLEKLKQDIDSIDGLSELISSVENLRM